ncbi:MAG: deoxyribonuclease IV [Muribaculaceae bacterium]|jgi:deoxyribonuclease-4|nr:deoxyribonuclease IV [Muribaculaceae bacterium]
MKYIGAHVPVTDGVASAPLFASAIGAGAFALFTRNPSRWKSEPLTAREIDDFRRNCAEGGFTPDRILPHDSYLINLGAKDPKKLFMSRMAFLDEMQRCEQLGLTMLNFHPGSHLNEWSEQECLSRIASSINHTLEKTSGVKAVIENTAGQGSNLGFSFAQIAEIIRQVEDKSRVGVCIDTCHALAAGYDFVTADGYETAWSEFADVIGMDYLCAMHINDSKKGVGSRVDRHAPIGQGALGLDFFRRLMADPRMDGIPLILETPDDTLWSDEISLLVSMAENREVR